MLGEPRELGPVQGKHRLVGGDHGSATPQRGADQIKCHAVPADQLADQIDLRILGQGSSIVVPTHTGEIDSALAVPVTGADGGHREPTAAAAGKGLSSGEVGVPGAGGRLVGGRGGRQA